jgi:hypothetical protein
MADHDEIGVVLRGSPHDLVRGMSNHDARLDVLAAAVYWL